MRGTRRERERERGGTAGNEEEGERGGGKPVTHSTRKFIMLCNFHRYIVIPSSGKDGGECSPSHEIDASV